MDYVEAFKNLKPFSKYGRKTPHKAILLLSIIEMYENGVLSNNEIRYNETLKNTFSNVWSKVFSSEDRYQPELCLTFWQMQVEQFWHVVPFRGKENVLELFNDPHIRASETMILENINYVELDDDLYFLMTLKSSRESLKYSLLETYTSLTEESMEFLSLSTDKFEDKSIVAVEEYKKILSSNNHYEVSKVDNVENEVNRFHELDEDLQIILNIEYYSFLKKNKLERELFKEICSSVYELYDKITLHPVALKDISTTGAFIYSNFLADLKISLLSEDGGMSLIDSINEAIKLLENNEDYSDSPILNIDEQFIEETNIKCYDSISLPVEPVKLTYHGEEDLGISKTNKDKTKNTTTNVEYENSVSLSTDSIVEFREVLPWTDNEDELLKLYSQLGYSVSKISTILGRTEYSVNSRLERTNQKIEKTELDKNEEIVSDNSLLDFSVENSFKLCSILNKYGERVYTTNGKLKIFHGKPYRFNYKSGFFTVKDMQRIGSSWDKGSKKLVADHNSDIYQTLDRHDFISHIEDFVEGENWKQSKILIDGIWYGYDGYRIDTLPDETMFAEKNASSGAVYSTLDNDTTVIDFATLKNIGKVAKCSYDFLWVLAIIDLIESNKNISSYSFDEIGCMMIAEAWEILNKYPQLKQGESKLFDCIEYLIQESKTNMDKKLYWFTTKNIVYSAIKNYPMSDVFEETIDTLLTEAPYNCLKIWITEDEEKELVTSSNNFKNTCLYSVHPYKLDPKIVINPKWSSALSPELCNITHEIKKQFINYCTINK